MVIMPVFKVKLLIEYKGLRSVEKKKSLRKRALCIVRCYIIYFYIM